MNITWPSSVGFYIALVVGILLLIALIFFKGALDAVMLAWFLLALVVAILLR